MRSAASICRSWWDRRESISYCTKPPRKRSSPRPPRLPLPSSTGRTWCACTTSAKCASWRRSAMKFYNRICPKRERNPANPETVYRMFMTRVFLPLMLAVAAFSQTRGRLGEYALVLEDAPVARKVQSRAALRSTEAQTHARKIRDAQSGVVAELQRRGVAVTGATQILVNAVIVSATHETAAELRKLPGV